MQLPKPSASIAVTIFKTRAVRSGWPWGRNARWETFAAVNSIAEALGHAAAQAPQPMQAAASIARSAFCFATRVAFASGAEPARRLAAADPNAQVHKWRPPADERAPSLFAAW